MDPSYCASKRNRRVLLAALLGSILAIAGCNASQKPQATADPQERASSVESTVGPVSLDETVTAGPYEICLTRGQLLSDPQAGPDRAAIPTIPEGHVLVDVWITVRNPSTTDGSEGLPVPDLEGFRLIDNQGETVAGAGLGFSRSESVGSSYRGGLGATMTQPIGPGEFVVLMPDYVVPADSAPLTLFFMPLSDQPGLIVEFSVQ